MSCWLVEADGWLPKLDLSHVKEVAWISWIQLTGCRTWQAAQSPVCKRDGPNLTQSVTNLNLSKEVVCSVNVVCKLSEESWEVGHTQNLLPCNGGQTHCPTLHDCFMAKLVNFFKGILLYFYRHIPYCNFFINIIKIQLYSNSNCRHLGALKG